jgi:hypothetical protein
VIRGFSGASIAPKLGEAGLDDCPTCDGTGLDLHEQNPSGRRSARLWDKIEELA